MNEEVQLPEPSADASKRDAFKYYRQAVAKAEKRATLAEAQRRYIAGQLSESKQREGLTYARLIDALKLLGEYRMILRAQHTGVEQAMPEDTK